MITELPRPLVGRYIVRSLLVADVAVGYDRANHKERVMVVELAKRLQQANDMVLLNIHAGDPELTEQLEARGFVSYYDIPGPVGVCYRWRRPSEETSATGWTDSETAATAPPGSVVKERPKASLRVVKTDE